MNLAPSNPQLTVVDPYANAQSSPDGLKPARPFWYAVDKAGLKMMRLSDNYVVATVPWPSNITVVEPDGEFGAIPAPSAGWDPTGITASYPTEEALASNSETPPTYVYVVMKHSGYEWQTASTPPAGQDPNVRDTLVAQTDPAKDSSLLLQVDVTDPTFSAFLGGPADAVSGAILGHDAGQPAFDPGTGNVYVGNMPSASLPTGLSSFVSVIAPIAPPVAEAAAPGAAPEEPMVVTCGPEHPEDGVLLGAAQVWPCTESGDGPASWNFQNLPSWLHPHVATTGEQAGKYDGLLYGTPDVVGTWTYQAQVIDYAENPAGIASAWAPYTMTVTTTAPNEAGEGGFEAGVPGGQPVEGTGSCTPGVTPSSPGSLVPAWIDVKTSTYNGVVSCFVMGTAPISGEHYDFSLPGFHFAYPYDRETVTFSGDVAGAYVFDPLPTGVGLSGLAWHEIEKIHDPSTEADILNAEFIGVEPSTGQLYQILLPQGVVEGSGGDVTGPPETSIEPDTVKAEGAALLGALTSARTDIANALSGNESLKVRFGDLAVESDRDIYVSASQISDPSGAVATVIPIGGTASPITAGALLRVKGGTAGAIDLPGVQAYYLGLDSNLAPAIRGVEPGQVDHGILWVTGTTTGNVAVVDTHNQTVAPLLTVPDPGTPTGVVDSLGGVSVQPATGRAYVAGPTLQNVTVFGAGSSTTQEAPRIWGEGLATFAIGQLGRYDIVATGSPTPQLTQTGTLPPWLTFTDNKNGTATITGTPPIGSGGDYIFNIGASNGVTPNASQAFTLTVGAPPVFTSAAEATFSTGCNGTFLVTTTGAASLVTLTQTGTLPAGVTWTDNEDGTATIGGTPTVVGNYPLTLGATTGYPPDATQAFVLHVITGTGTCVSAPVVTTNPVSQTVTAPLGATFTAAASGNPTPTVQWQRSTNNGSTWSNAPGTSTGTSYSTGATTTAMNGYQYRAVFTNSASTATTSTATLTVQGATGTGPAVTTQPASRTVTAPATATFTAAASGNPLPNAQWQQSTNGGATWTSVGTVTATGSTSYTTPATTAAMNGYRYRVEFTNQFGAVFTNAAVLTVRTAPAITTQPVTQTVTAPQQATFTAAASGNPAPTVQWQQSINGGGTWSNITGATSASYTTPATSVSMNGYRYRAVFTNSVGSATTSAAILTINTVTAAPSITTQPVNRTVSVGQTATFTAAASGNPAPTVQWQRLTTATGATWTNITGATSASYTTPATTLAMNGYRFRAVFRNTLGAATTTAAILTINTVNAAPSITTQPLNQTVTAGQTAVFTAAASGSPAPTVQWQRLTTAAGAVWTNISGATNPRFATATSLAMNGNKYRAVFRNSQGTATTNPAKLTVASTGRTLIVATTTLPNGTVGQSYSTTLAAAGGVTPYTWSRSSGSLPSGLGLSSAGVISGTPTAAGTYTFVVRVADSASHSATATLSIVIAP